MIGFLLGALIWLAMLAQNLLLAAVSIVVSAALGLFWAPSQDALKCDAMMGTAWRVAWVALLQPFASLLMPAFIAAWRWLPARLAYWLNTPDDQDPATQGWNGNNKEKQVIWVHAHCGAFWTRVYWLERNCLYGLNVALRPWHINTNGPYILDITAKFSYDGKWLIAKQVLSVAYCRRFPLFGGWRNIWFGYWLPAYLRKLGPPCEVSPDADPDPTTDTGGVACLKFKKEMA